MSEKIKDVVEILNTNPIIDEEELEDDAPVVFKDVETEDDLGEFDETEEVELIPRHRTKKKERKQTLDFNGKSYEDVIKEMGLTPKLDNHYVDNAELYLHMVKYCEERDKAKELGLPKPKLDDFIGEAIMKIATHLSFRPNFIGYSYRYDMIGDAIENCLTYIDSFDPKRSKNAFSYLTQICWCAFIRRLKIEKKNSCTIGKLMMQQDFTDNMQLDNDEDGANLANTQHNMHRYVEIAEEEEEKRLAKKAIKEAEKFKKKNMTPLTEFFDVPEEETKEKIN